MNKRKNLVKSIIILCIGTLIVLQSADAYAWWAEKCIPQHDTHPRRNIRLPHHHNKIVLSNIIYYYDGSVYYRQGHHEYVLVTAPIGAIVSTLPVGYSTIIINGTKYHTYDNVYYLKQPSGYVVVPAPTLTTPTLPVPTTTNDETYVVNVPNANGSYTPVVIKKEDNAYICPQGEYYSQAPTVEQLKVMYAK